MSKKDKTSEINDIIDSSYTEADYSCGSEYYDEVDSHRRRNTYNSSFGNNGSNPFSKISSIRPPVTSTNALTSQTNTSNTSNTSNIFMKYTSNTNNASDKSAATPSYVEIKNTEDEFPSLGGGGGSGIGIKKPVAPKIQAPMNFKKIVETKKPVEVQQQVVQQKSRQKHDDYYDRFRVYEEVKYYSEKTARSKIYRSGYSDDEDVDDLDDMDDDDE